MNLGARVRDVKTLLQGDYHELEIWSKSLDYDVLSGYVHHVVQGLEEDIPGLRVLSTRKSDSIEFRTCPPLGFRGYVIKVGAEINPEELKDSCMELEHYWGQGRICDIDVYSKGGKKISRKNRKC